MTDDELVEKVAQEIDPHACWTPMPNWTIAPDIVKAWQDAARVKARAILSIARPPVYYGKQSADRVAELEAALRDAQEALGPFAKHGKLIDEQFADNDDDVIGAGFHEDPITLGDFRRANSTHAEIDKVLK